MILDRPLPEACYSLRLLQPTGVLVHFISALISAPNMPFDPQACFDILVANKVSAHYMVLRNGDVWRLVPENYQAWHAGKSRFRGVDSLNATFLGIEFIGAVDMDFEDAQYQSGAALVCDLMARHAIATNRIKGHEQVSGARVRSDFKEDPGPCFDWLRFGALVA